MVKTVHVAFASQGGAGNAAINFCRMQRMYGINSEFICRTIKIRISDIIFHPVLFVFALIDYLLISKKKVYFFSLFRSKLSSQLLKNIKESIVHIHWAPGMATIKDLSALARNNLKIFIHLHDMWFLTGGCHHSFSCMGFTINCNTCPFARKIYSDIIRESKFQKLVFLKQDNVYLIAPSTWMQKKIELMDPKLLTKSRLIPNPVNPDNYRPLSKSLAKKIIGVDPNNIVLGFVASNLNDANKGIQNFVGELEKSRDGSKITLLFVGDGQIKTHMSSLNFKYVENTSQMSILYSAMDVFINPSIVETFSYTNLEASLHNTPVLSLKNGGSSDTISANLNGFELESINDIISKISELLLPNSSYNKIAQNSRSFVLDKFGFDHVNKQLVDFYNL
jgi:glycosyltransferase involved in cell wall biosynthesis